MKIRKATTKDSDRIIEIEWGSGYKWNKNKKSCEEMINKVFKEGFCEIYILEDKDKEISYFALSFDTKKKLCYINYFAVKKEYQGKGIGSLMKEEQIRVAKKHKSKALETTVWAKNFKMISLNSKYGFYVTDIKRGHYPNGDDKLRMRKDL